MQTDRLLGAPTASTSHTVPLCGAVRPLGAQRRLASTLGLKQGRPDRRVTQTQTASTAGSWESAPNEATQQAEPAKPLQSTDVQHGIYKFWASYNKLLDTRPILTKSLTSLFGFMIGDVLAQTIAGQSYNAMRTVRMTLFGILMDGPIGHLWYTLLDKYVYPDKPKSNRAVVSKMLCDQVLWAPAFTCVFFLFMCCLEGRPHMVGVRIRQKLLQVMLTNYAVWPLAHIINFRFIPTSQRILYINACQILWSCYLSTLQAAA